VDGEYDYVVSASGSSHLQCLSNFDNPTDTSPNLMEWFEMTTRGLTHRYNSNHVKAGSYFGKVVQGNAIQVAGNINFKKVERGEKI
jgi:hypothetical protein